MLVVIAIIGILAGMTVHFASRGMTQRQLTRVEMEREQIQLWIEDYKAKKGYYPLDNTNNDALPPLYYELAGAVIAAKPAGREYTTRDGRSRVVMSNELWQAFGVRGLLNASGNEAAVRTPPGFDATDALAGVLNDFAPRRNALGRKHTPPVNPGLGQTQTKKDVIGVQMRDAIPEGVPIALRLRRRRIFQCSLPCISRATQRGARTGRRRGAPHAMCLKLLVLATFLVFPCGEATITTTQITARTPHKICTMVCESIEDTLPSIGKRNDQL